MTFEEEVFNQYVGIYYKLLVVKTHSEVNQKMAFGRKLNAGNWGV